MCHKLLLNIKSYFNCNRVFNDGQSSFSFIDNIPELSFSGTLVLDTNLYISLKLLKISRAVFKIGFSWQFNERDFGCLFIIPEAVFFIEVATYTSWLSPFRYTTFHQNFYGNNWFNQFWEYRNLRFFSFGNYSRIEL